MSGMAPRRAGTRGAPARVVTANRMPSPIAPAVVVLACLPLTAVKILTYALMLVSRADPDGVALFGFALTFAFLFLFYPALLLLEPIAIITTVWYTNHFRYNEPVSRLLVCWFALAVHSLVLVSYLAAWHR
jgi:hypothetical protein